MVTSLLLVHSPLVGPSSWAAAAEVLAGRGAAVRVPDLTGVVTAGSSGWRQLVRTAAAAVAELPGAVSLVGHSGAGAFLPAIGAQVGDRLDRSVFVDAVLPPAAGSHETPPALAALLDEQTVDGRLRRWLDWWPPATVEELLPDPADRRALLADMPQLPRSFYDEPVPVPDGWAERRCAYLKLSDAYAAEYDEAGARGWPRAELDASHLSLRTDPARVVAAVLSLLDEDGDRDRGSGPRER